MSKEKTTLQQKELFEKKQHLILKIRVAVASDRMDLVEQLSLEYQKLLLEEQNNN
jgi:hypothetical protein